MKIIYTIIFLIFSGSLIGQPMLSSSNLPSAGDSYSVNTATSLPPGSNQGNAGSNMTWDFSGLSASGTDPLTYSINNDTDYPSANLYFLTQGTRNYFEVTNNAYTYYGFSANLADEIFTDGQDQIRVPLAFNDQYSDSFTGTFSGFSQTIDRQGSLDVTYDAYGTLTTPEGTYSNVLRVQIIRTSTDSDNGTTIAQNLDSIYFWYNVNTPHPIMTYSINYVDGSETGRFANYISDADVIQSLPKRVKDAVSVKVYPNPVEDQLNIDFKEKKISFSEIEIVDANAAITKVASLEGTENSLDISNLKQGIYFYRITNDERSFNGKFIKN